MHCGPTLRSCLLCVLSCALVSSASVIAVAAAPPVCARPPSSRSLSVALMFTRVSTQHAPPQRTTDMDLPPLFDLSLAEREETLEEQPQPEGAAAAAAAGPKPARVNPQTVAAASQVAAGSIGSVLASAAMAATTPAPSAVAAAAAASSSHSLLYQHQPQPSAPPPSASLDFPPDFAVDGNGEGFDEDLYGTRMSLPSFVSSILASPRALSDRAGFELELLQNLAAAPEVQNQIYREATIIPEMMKKNRYSNVIPNRASRVILPSASSNPADSYINACSLPPLLGGSIQSYIACQAPLPHTMSDFWHMVWTQQTALIVMLTKTAERDARGNVIHKAHSYWPESQEEDAAVNGQGSGKPKEDSLPSVRYAPYTVTLLSTHQEPELIIRELLLTYDGGVDGGADDVNAPPPRHVHQLQYTGWPDFGVPDDSDPTKGFVRIFTLYRAIRNHLHQQHQAAAAAAGAEGAGGGGEGAGKSASSSSAASASSFSRAPPASTAASANLPAPIVVHCSAGIGRSGVWIAVDALLDHLSMHTAAGSLPHAFVDMFALVRRMRQSRQGMLQTKEQYAYVLHFVATCMQKQLFGVDEKAVATQLAAAAAGKK